MALRGHSMANDVCTSLGTTPSTRHVGQPVSASDFSSVEPETGSPITPNFFWSVVGVTLFIAILVRLPHFASPDFPLGEGGLFVLFTELIVKSDFRLPIEGVYGGFNLPFAYPPAGFYLAGAVSRLTGADLFSVFYWLPILLNLLAVPAFCLMAAEVTRNRIVMASASLLYGQLVHSYIWQITGGGLPRALAALFALLAIGLAFRNARKPSAVLSISVGLLVGLTILSHVEWGIFAAFGVALALFTTAGLRRGLLLSAATGLVSAILVLPWVVTILLRHGTAPFLSISSASEWDGASFVLNVIAAKFFYLVGWAAIPGVYKCVGERNWFPIFLTLTLLILTPRMGVSAGLAIPVALFAGWGVKAGADFLSRTMISDPEVSPIHKRYLMDRVPWGIGIPVIAILLLMSAVLASPVRGNSADFSTLKQVNLGSRSAMRWAAQHTSPDSRFVIISRGRGWWADRIAEWFPYLSQRNSLTTAQGMEWVGPGEFTKRKETIQRLKVVQIAAPALAPVFTREAYCAATHIAVFYPAGHPVRNAFTTSPYFKLVYANLDAAILEVRVHRCISVG